MSVRPLLCEVQDKYTQLASMVYIENNQEFPPPLWIKILEKKDGDIVTYSHSTVWQNCLSKRTPVQ